MGDPVSGSKGPWSWLRPWRLSPGSPSDGSSSEPRSVPDRRSGLDRRTPTSQGPERLEEVRRQARRRAHVRQPLPFGGVAPSGRICRDGLGCVHASLVDLSEGGTCVLLSTPLPLNLGDKLELTLHENFGFGTLQVELEVRWLVETPMGLRVGGRFLDPAFRPSATFLKTYLEADFGNQRRPDR